MDDDFFVIAMIMVGVFLVISCCMFGIFGCIAYNRRKNQAIYSTPVVITDQSFTPHHNQQAQFPIHLQTSSQTPPTNSLNQQQQQTSLPPYANQQPPFIPFPQPQPQQQHETRNVQMPMPYDNHNSFLSSNTSSNPPYPTSTASFPLPSNSSNQNADTEDAPPSYFKIDKLMN